jgi:hypothetical protein
MGKWYQVGFIWGYLTSSTSRQKLIINGVINATRDVNIPTPPTITSSLLIGRGIDCWEDLKINGFISNVQIYNRSLTPQELQQLYYAGIPPSNEIRIVLK